MGKGKVLDVRWYFSICFFSTAATMLKQEIHDAVSRYAVCNDFTPAVFYMRRQSAVQWIIYLESGGGCSSISECNDRYLVNEDGYNTTNELMSSSQLPASAVGRDLLSRDEEENPTFSHFTHVMIPYCSSDLWLGQGNHSRFPQHQFQFHNDSSVNDFIFRGYTIFHAAVDDLVPLGLANATEVLLVGSSAGGIGVINHVRYIQSVVPAATVATITDSSWFIDFENNLAVKFNREEARELSQYTLLPACQHDSQGYPCCISAKCMLQSHSELDDILFPPDTPLFTIFSLYDIYLLSESIKRLSDEGAGLFDYTRTVFLYGGAMNESVENAFTATNVSLFMPSCTQHVYLATTSLWDPGQLFNRSISHDYSRGTIYFNHAIRSGNWRRISIDGTSLQQAISSWYNSNYTLSHKLRDNCSAVICNPSCPDQVVFSVSGVDWSFAARAAVIIVAVSICAICAAVKVIMLLYQRWLIGGYSRYQTEEKDGKSFLPDCPKEDQMNLACFNLSYSLPQKTFPSDHGDGDGESPKITSHRPIINGISVSFNPGELVAVMGPSGSGKTTLLDVLMGRRAEGTDEGDVLINGIPREAAKNFVDYTGYVMQLATPYYDDLTVSENLLYSSVLRLPERIHWHDRFERVRQVMRETGLLHLANTPVGGLKGPGLSGGQKRRLSVALQLLSVPRILFLDEPTSGLDASSSLELLQTLHCLAISGRTVILTIHQPRLEIYHMFDKILFLCQGQVAYFGPPFNAPSFFSEAVEKLDIELPVEMNNPADTIMDILVNEDTQEEIVCYYKSSSDAEEVRKAIVASRRASAVQLQRAESKPGLFLRMFVLESRTSARQTLSRVIYLPVLFLLLGLLMGSTYWKSHSGLMIMSVYCIISSSSAIFISSIVMGLLVQPLHIFAVEHQDGVSKSIDMVLHVFIRVSAISIFPVTLGVFLTYVLVTLKYVWTDFFSVLLIQLLVNHTWVAVFILVVCCNPVMAHRICPLISALAGFASGFIVALPNMPIYYRWLFPINPTYWGYAATIRILLDDVDFGCEYDSQLECFPFTGLYMLELFGLHDANPYVSIVVLVGILIACLALSIVVLEIKYPPHVMNPWSRRLFSLTQTRSQVQLWTSSHSTYTVSYWPSSHSSQSVSRWQSSYSTIASVASQQPRQYCRPNASHDTPSERHVDGRRSSGVLAQPSGRSLPKPNSMTFHLSEDRSGTHQDQAGLSHRDTRDTKSPRNKMEIPIIYEESAETDSKACSPSAVFPDDVHVEEGHSNASSLMGNRSDRSRCILEQRRKEMEARLHLWSTSVAASAELEKGKSTANSNRRSTAPSVGHGTERNFLSVGGPLVHQPIHRRRSSTPAARTLNTHSDFVQLNALSSVNDEQRRESPSHLTAASNHMKPEQHSQSLLSPLSDYPPGRSDRIKSNQEQPTAALSYVSDHATSLSPPHFPLIAPTREQPGVREEAQQHDELFERQPTQERLSPTSQTSVTSEGQ